MFVSNTLGSVASTGAVLTVIPVSAPGTRLATLHTFSLSGGEGWPPSGRALGADGKLYGTTYFGRTVDSCHGNVFSVATNGDFTIVVAFRGTNGSRPQAAPVQGADGDFYGTTEYGVRRALARCSR